TADTWRTCCARTWRIGPRACHSAGTCCAGRTARSACPGSATICSGRGRPGTRASPSEPQDPQPTVRVFTVGNLLHELGAHRVHRHGARRGCFSEGTLVVLHKLGTQEKAENLSACLDGELQFLEALDGYETLLFAVAALA